MQKEITIQFTPEEVKMLIEIINAVNFQGNSIEQIYPLKQKIKSALEIPSESKTDKKE